MSETDPMRVLHVDDDPHILDLTSRFLEEAEEPLAVDSTVSVDEARHRLAATDYECVVCDRGALKQGLVEIVCERDDRLPVLLFTAGPSDEVIREALDAGVDDYKRKERSSDQYTFLANRIRNLVERYRAERCEDVADSPGTVSNKLSGSHG